MRLSLLGISPLTILLVGCIPKIEVAAPKEPITINMNVKIDHEINIKADPQAQQLINQRQAEKAPEKMQPPGQ